MLEALWLGVLRLGDLRQTTADAVLLLLLLSLVYLTTGYPVLKNAPIKGWLILGAAMMFRLTAWHIPPTLSDDLRRYQWEGRIQQEGHNPYATSPVSLGERSIPGADFKAVYGPLTEAAQSLAYRVGGGTLVAMKLPAVLADLALVAWLYRRFPGRALIYAWCPLPILEFWSQGHNDALAILWLLPALMGIAPGVFLGLAAAFKWWPLLLLPALAKTWRDWAIAPAIVGIAALPYLGGMRLENAQFASGFLGGWRNNDSVFGLILFLTGDPYRAKYAAFALICALALVVSRTAWPAPKKALWTVAGMLFLSANVHPWYSTWLFPALVFEAALPLLLWIAVIPIAYESVVWWNTLGEWRQSESIRWLIYSPVAACLLLQGIRSLRLTPRPSRLE